MRRLFLLAGIIFIFFLSVTAQEKTVRDPFPVPEKKVFTLGATIGFNTIFPIINSLSIDDVQLENYRLDYKVGYLASFFCRINMDRFFIQPSISWYRSEGEIQIDISDVTLPDLKTDDGSNMQYARLAMKTNSLQVPVLIGYNIVESGPYGLSFMAGPSLKYNHKVSYTSIASDVTQEFLSDSTPYGIGIAMGVTVKIWELFFDFSYELGLNQTESDFKSKNPENLISPDGSLRIDKRTNMMSFSLGFAF